MKAYKPEQGRMARMAAFWSLALLILFGCTFLHEALASNSRALQAPIGGLIIPIVSIKVSGAFLISTLILVGSLLWLNRYMSRPKAADFLIEVEAEMRKVTWPTMDQVINASIVVVVTVAILMGYLAGSDFVLNKLVQRLIYGWGS